jgi:trans-aconitate methyltransferase
MKVGQDRIESRWAEVWAKRGVDLDVTDLSNLIVINGFDSQAARVDAESWRVHARAVANYLSLRRGESVFEVGCGAGAFLLPFAELFGADVGGVDLSERLIEIARLVLPEGDFICGQASALEPSPQKDYVIAHSVFQYLGLNEAEETLRRMVAKARNSVLVLDVPDESTRNDSESFRMAGFTREQYETRYSGLPHTYYEKEWFSEVSAGLGKRVDFFETKMSGYLQAKYRFGVHIL